jgi:hypothetical protein
MLHVYCAVKYSSYEYLNIVTCTLLSNDLETNEATDIAGQWSAN